MSEPKQESWFLWVRRDLTFGWLLKRHAWSEEAAIAAGRKVRDGEWTVMPADASPKPDTTPMGGRMPTHAHEKPATICHQLPTKCYARKGRNSQTDD